MRVGVLVSLSSETDIRKKFAEVQGMGMCSCQLVCWDRKVFRTEGMA